MDYYFQSKLMSKYSALARTISYPLVCIYRVVLVVMRVDVRWFGWATVFDSFLIGSFLLFFYKRSKGDTLSFSWKTGKDLLNHGKHFVLVNLLVTIYTQMDRLMLGSMADQGAVGIYSAAMMISNLWIFIPNALIDSARPLIMELKVSDKREAYQKRWRQLYAGVIWLGILAGIFFSVFSKLIVWLIYGETYSASAGVLMILIWSRLFSLLGVLRSTWMLCEGYEKYVKYFVGLGAVINVILNCILIPIMGANGAAIATLITEVVSSLLVSMVYKKTKTLTSIIWDAFCFRGIR
jgi:PST family polysaccharide transporter